MCGVSPAGVGLGDTVCDLQFSLITAMQQARVGPFKTLLKLLPLLPD
jgi:hypothetical protein